MKVFLSSTYLDLKPHRCAVNEILGRLQQTWRGMEQIGSRPDEPRKVCLEEIARCDAFIGIYAYRYGFVPPGSSTSITEQEFDYARGIGKDLYCYVIDPQHEWLPQFIDDGSSGERVRLLKEKVGLLVRSTFTTPDDLAKKIAADLQTAWQSLALGKTPRDVVAHVCLGCQREIRTSIGRKYIPELYVPRRITKLLHTELRSWRHLKEALERCARSISQIRGSLQRTVVVLEDEIHKKARPVQLRQAATRKAEAELVAALVRTTASVRKTDEALGGSKPTQLQRVPPVNKMKLRKRVETYVTILKREEKRNRLQNQRKLGLVRDAISDLRAPNQLIEQAVNDQSLAETLSYPADAIINALDCINELGHRMEVEVGIQEESSWSPALITFRHSSEFVRLHLRPVIAVIDRAGGGKTNLLCRLAYDIGKRIPVFFLSARAISEPTSSGILHYLSTAYSIQGNPIKSSLAALDSSERMVVVVIDGINEHFDPFRFVLAFQQLVRECYGLRVRFVLSCRDVYWHALRDNWWDSHCALEVIGQLYSFTRRELARALPDYLTFYRIKVSFPRKVEDRLLHPLLLRFFCEAYSGDAKTVSNIGRLSDLRLLPLFRLYCRKKYLQIQERLRLGSAEQIRGFLAALGAAMLGEEKPLLSFDRVREISREQVGQITAEQLGSVYSHILDEDIILQSKPSPDHNQALNVSFVYDEFMEFLIAEGLWRGGVEVHFHGDRLRWALGNVAELLKRRKKFLNCTGIVLYLGEMLAESSPMEAISLLDRLTDDQEIEIAVNLILRWPIASRSDEVFRRLLRLHAAAEGNLAFEALKAIEELCQEHWQLFFDYLKSLPPVGRQRPMYAYSLLSRVGGGITAAERRETINWILETLRSGSGISAGGADLRQGLLALKRITEAGAAGWSQLDYQACVHEYRLPGTIRTQKKPTPDGTDRHALKQRR